MSVEHYERLRTSYQAESQLQAFDRIMSRKGGEEPRAGDELPPEWWRRRLGRGAAAASANQVDGGAEFEERIG